MDFQLSEGQKMLRDTVRKFATEKILPHWQRLRKKAFPKDIFEEMIRAGFSGAVIPEEYGGQGLDLVSFAMLVEEMCRADGGVGLSVGASLSLVAKPIINFGDEEQKRFWLPKVASGEVIGAYAQTEPDIGSDVAHIRATGVVEGDELIISGTKRFITNGSIADLVLVLVRTEPDAAPHRGLTLVLVDAKAAREAGTLIIDKDYDKMGLHCSPTSELTFIRCRVPVSNILGRLGMGFLQAMATLIGSRSMIAAQGVGLAQAAFDEAVSYAKTREQFGKKLGELPVVYHKLARMAMKIEAIRLLTYQAAWETETKGFMQSGEFMEKASFAKLHASEVATEVALASLEIHGGMGYMAESRISAILQDAIVLRIYEGASNIQAYIIAKKLLDEHGLNINPA